MGYNGDGSYTRARNFSADASAGIKILASAMDQEFDDFASAMTLPVLRDGQNTPTANLPMGGFRHTNVDAAASVTDYLRVREFITDVPILVADNDTSLNVVSVSVDFYASASAALAPPDGAKLRIRSNTVKTTSSAVLRLTTPLGTHSAPIHYLGKPILQNQISNLVTHEYIYSSASAAWEIVNPRPARRLVNLLAKAKDVAGVITGQEAASAVYDIRKDGNILTLAHGGTISVSVSLSSKYIFLSGLPQTFIDAATGGVQIFMQRASGSQDMLSVLTIQASASIRIEPVSLVLSANEVFEIPPFNVHILD